MLVKTRVKLILLLTAVDLVYSCLVTNCPRGGKRGDQQFTLSTDNMVQSQIKMCKFCHPGEEICLGVYCSSEVSCGEEGQCVAVEVCCSKRFCRLHKICGSESRIRKRKELRSVILTKILRYKL